VKIEAELKKRMAEVICLLRTAYPEATCSLTFKTPHQLLVSTILSAQCTDKRVNQVTPDLFNKYRSIKDFAKSNETELAQDIHSCGYHNQKARAIKGSSQIICEEFGGKVPKTLEELVKLPGVGRKTANCVLGTSFGIPSVVIDTHMIRIMNLLGFTETQTPEKIEQDIMLIAQKDDWIDLTHLIIEHGRELCIARRPRCDDCLLHEVCPSSKL
tara:strand:+ start:97 stop:738 length:642 start_codon:yes stop_codon:yes gene_type:complete